MIRIGLEAGFDPSWPAGLLYVRNLVYSLVAVPKGERPLVRLLPTTADTVGRIADLEQFEGVEIAAPIGVHPSLLEARLRLRRAVRKYVQPQVGRVLDHSFRNLDVTYPGFGRPLPDVPQMQWIPDLQHVHLPHLFRRSEVAKRDQRIQQIAGSEDLIVFSSKVAMDDFGAHYPHAKPRGRVWRFCTTISKHEWGGGDPRAIFGLPQTYLYVANQFWTHKEHLTLFKALLTLRNEGMTPTVVCSGAMREPRDPTYVPGLIQFLAHHGLDEQVRLLGLLDRKDQLQVLRCSAGVVQPSSFEGWSTVIEDAKTVGRPILASDIAVHLEQVPEGTFFQTGSQLDLARAIATWLPNLNAGPEPALEEAAAARAEERRRRAGREFIHIAQEASNK